MGPGPTPLLVVLLNINTPRFFGLESAAIWIIASLKLQSNPPHLKKYMPHARSLSHPLYFA